MWLQIKGQFRAMAAHPWPLHIRAGEPAAFQDTQNQRGENRVRNHHIKNIVWEMV